LFCYTFYYTVLLPDTQMDGMCDLVRCGAVQVLGTIDEKPGIVYADLDYAEIETRRLNMPLMQQKRCDLYSLHGYS
jgi:predicted amidohydrolase